MSDIRKMFIIILLLSGILLSAPNLFADGKKKHEGAGAASTSTSQQSSDYTSMPGPGNKVSIGKDHYLIYGFNKKPKMGTVIIKVQVYSNDSKKDTSFEIKGDSGMPSMGGAHDTGDRPFRISKSGDYLLPIDIVMPGDWEIRLTISKAGKVVFKGKYEFNV